MFNVCFVCHPWSRTVQYEPALIKLSNFLKDLELDSEFLYNEFNNEALQDILEKVFRDLNAKGECSVRALNYTLELKVISIAPDPPQVCIFCRPISRKLKLFYFMHLNLSGPEDLKKSREKTREIK